MEKCVETAEIVTLKIDFPVAEEVHSIYPTILRDKEEMILVDCGYPGFLPLIEERAAAKGVDLGTLTGVIVTHHDYDHYGGLSELKRAYPRVRVMASEQDADYIRGRKKSLRFAQTESMYDSLREDEKDEAKRFQERLGAVVPAEVDVELHDGDAFPWCGGTEIVATPGHMPGHISIYVRRHKTLITGDAMIAIKGRLRIAGSPYALDMTECKRSIAKLMSYDIETFICYHGGIVSTNLSHRRHRHLLR